MKVLVAMSGGVDSSVAAALLAEAGHEIVGATMKLWGGGSDSGCCSVSDVEDARRVAAQLGIDHHVFNFTEDFEVNVIGPYVDAHSRARTPNPCIECNRHLKFDRFLLRAVRLGFDAIATGHYARVFKKGNGSWGLRRGADAAKDQSYVLAMLGQAQLARVLLPIGGMTKEEVRARAAGLGLRTAAKPDSQDVCFITSTGGREGFLGSRISFTPGTLVDDGGVEVGRVPALELVTVGQRRGIRPGRRGERRYVCSVDLNARTARVGAEDDVLASRVFLENLAWTDGELPGGSPVEVQVSAHGSPIGARFGIEPESGPGGAEVVPGHPPFVDFDASERGGRDAAAAPVPGHPPFIEFDVPQRRVAPGQTVAFYRGDAVLGCAIATGNG